MDDRRSPSARPALRRRPRLSYVTALAFAACTDSPAASTACLTQEDCNAAFVCTAAGVCARPCVVRGDCPTGEACVDGACATRGCGNGVVDRDEECDDDNNDDLDGCNSTCRIESGFLCAGAPSLCVPQCGDGERVGPETCDDDNATAGDGCSASCTTEAGCTCDVPGTACVCAPCLACTANQLCLGAACVDRCAEPSACPDGELCVSAAAGATYCAPASTLVVRGGFAGPATSAGPTLRVVGGIAPVGGTARGDIFLLNPQ